MITYPILFINSKVPAFRGVPNRQVLTILLSNFLCSLPDQFPCILNMVPGYIRLPDHYSQGYQPLNLCMCQKYFTACIKVLHQFFILLVNLFRILLPCRLVTETNQSQVLWLKQLKIRSLHDLSGKLQRKFEDTPEGSRKSGSGLRYLLQNRPSSQNL